jgi:hypothetical protein
MRNEKCSHCGKWKIESVALVAVGFWVYAIVTGGKNF